MLKYPDCSEQLASQFQGEIKEVNVVLSTKFRRIMQTTLIRSKKIKITTQISNNKYAFTRLQHLKKQKLPKSSQNIDVFYSFYTPSSQKVLVLRFFCQVFIKRINIIQRNSKANQTQEHHMQANFFQSSPNFQGMPPFYQQLMTSYLNLNKDYDKISQTNANIQKAIQQKVNDTLEMRKKITDIRVKLQNIESTQSYELKKRAPTAQSEIKYQIEKFNRRGRKSLKKRPKSFTCLFHDCNKSYESDVSLNLHMKIKHNVGPKKERLLYAKMIKQSIEKGVQPPNLNITFPPNFLNQYIAKNQE